MCTDLFCVIFFFNKVKSAGVLDFGGTKEMLQGTVLHFISIQPVVFKTFTPCSAYPLTLIQTPASSGGGSVLRSPGVGLKAGLAAIGVRLRSSLSERQTKPRRQEEDEVMGSSGRMSRALKPAFCSSQLGTGLCSRHRLKSGLGFLLRLLGAP